MLKRRLKRPKGVLNIRKMCAQRWQLHTLQEFMKELVRRVRIGIIAHKDTHSRVIEYGIAFIGIAIIEDDAEQIRMILKLRRQEKAKLPTKK